MNLKSVAFVASAALGVYYCHWEHQIYGALQSAVVRGLKEWLNALTAKHDSDSPNPQIRSPAPLFKVLPQLLIYGSCDTSSNHDA